MTTMIRYWLQLMMGMEVIMEDMETTMVIIMTTMDMDMMNTTTMSMGMIHMNLTVHHMWIISMCQAMEM